MKKLSLYIFLGLLFCNVSFGEEVEYSGEGLNLNIVNHGWIIDKSEFIKIGNMTVEIYTLEKEYKNEYFLLKCQIAYYETSLSTYCRLP